MKVYIASPFFNKKEREVKERIKNKLVSLNYDVLDPQPNGGSSSESWEKTNFAWSSEVFKKDIDKINEADMIVAINWGMYSDSGTAWEIGYASAINKKVIVITPTEALSETHSLMVANGCHSILTEQRFLGLSLKDFEENSYAFCARGLHLS